MDVLELIAEVLCRLDLPDRDVYPAMARYRDQPTSEAQEELLEAFVSSVRKGLDLPDAADPWRKLVEHPAFHLPDLYRQALQERAHREPVGLHTLLERTALLLNLTDPKLTELLTTLRSASSDQVERLLVPAFLRVVRTKLEVSALNTWESVASRPELIGEPELADQIRALGQIHAPANLSPLQYARQRAYLIRRALGEDPEPPNLDDSRDGGSPVPRSPQGPKPTLRHQQKPPNDAPPG